jgi:septal ring factor EnvC (AmiA/AmiB activator)
MGRKSVAELQDELAQEREDNAQLYAKVNNLRATIRTIRQTLREFGEEITYRRNRLSSPALRPASNTNAPTLRATE